MNNDMPGQMGDERPIGGWPDLIGSANLALRHFNEICDPGHSYMAYVGASLGYDTPAFTRSRWDWVEAASYGLPGRIAARRLTGNTAGEEVETGQRRLTLASFHGLDGFSRRLYAKRWSEDTTVLIWEQARVLFTLMAWYVESQDERLLGYVRGMLEALRGITRNEGKFRVFNPPFDRQDVFGDVAPMTLVEPLMKYFEVTDDADALDFCQGVVNWAVDPATNFTDDGYRISGWLRGHASALAGIARFAASTDDTKLLQYTEGVFRRALELTTRYGGTPDTEPCCTNMELTTTALALTKAGHGEWWDMIDRHFRNHTLACQFTDPAAVNTGSSEGGPRPYDDTRDILDRSVGGFSWATAREHLFDGEQLMLCCGGNAMWTLGKIAANAATLDDKGLSINLHFSLDTPLARITSNEPFEGRLEVVPRREGRVRVRRPTFATKVEARIDGAEVTPRDEGTYLAFQTVAAGSTVVLSYAMPETTSEETTWTTAGKDCFDTKSAPVIKERIETRWRGNTVIAIDYERDSPQPLHRLYEDRLEGFREGKGRDDTARFFLPEKPYDW